MFEQEQLTRTILCSVMVGSQCPAKFSRLFVLNIIGIINYCNHLLDAYKTQCKLFHNYTQT